MTIFLAQTTAGLTGSTTNRVFHSGLSALDWGVIGAYFLFILLMGYYFSLKQEDTDEYFVGSRRMPWFAVGLSILATLCSTISFLAVPGEMIKNGLGILAGLVGSLPAFLIVGYIFVPYFMSRRLTTAYEYLEQRFDLPTRILGSCLFMVARLGWMGIVTLAASQALAKIAGLDDHVELVAIMIGAIAVVYTTLGGLRAVIWTDVVQFIILFAAAVFTVVYVAWDTATGPVTWWWVMSETAAQRPEQPFFSLDPFVRVSLVGIVITEIFYWVCTAGSDQVAIQRYLSTSSVAAARRSFGLNLVAGIFLMFVLVLCGIALHFYYLGDLPGTPDQVFPHFIRHSVPRGLAGLIVAGLFSAAMSSLDSGLNSISSVVTVDFFRRLSSRPPSPRQELWVARIVTTVTGVAAVLVCVWLLNIPEETRGNFTDLTSRISNFMAGPMGGLFLVAILIKRCQGRVAIFSTLIGIVVASILSLGHLFLDLGLDAAGQPRAFSWMWVIPGSCVVTFLSASAITWLQGLFSRIEGGRAKG